jgi:hypothetical protein
MRTPSSSSTSAAPVFEVTDRFPCFTTHAPQAAATNIVAVETLKKPCRSPPVPHTSMVGPGNRVASSSTATARWRSDCAKAAISPAVSPLSRSALRKAVLSSWRTAGSINAATASSTCGGRSSEPACNKEISDSIRRDVTDDRAGEQGRLASEPPAKNDSPRILGAASANRHGPLAR